MRVLVNENEIPVTGVKIKSGLATFCAGCTISTTEAILPGSKIVVKKANETIFRGTSEKLTYTLTGDQKTAQISARDQGAALVDSDFPPDTADFSSVKTLEAAVVLACGPFGLSVKVNTETIDIEPPQIDPGQSVFSFLEQLSRETQTIFYMKNGQVIIDKIGRETSVLVLDMKSSLIEISISMDMSQRFGKYFLLSEDDVEEKLDLEISDTRTKALFDGNSLEWELAYRKARSDSVNAALSGYIPNIINRLIRVNLPTFGDKSYLVNSWEYSYNSDGEQTILGLVGKDAYTPKTPTKRAEKENKWIDYINS